MKKIGLIDYYLSEWHANSYPAWIAASCKEQNLDYKICYAYGEIDKSPKDNMLSSQWCEKFGAEQCKTIAELVEKSDCIMVLAPSNPETHERLAREALMSGKPLYIDKTFAPSSAAAIRMFELAEKYKTPMYSSSALRFSSELAQFRAGEKANSSFVMGGSKFEEYCIHVFEMVVTLMHCGAKRLMCGLNGGTKTFTIEYDDSRRAATMHSDSENTPFAISVDGKQSFYTGINSDFFRKFIDEVILFFETGLPAVQKNETIEIAKLIDAAKIALNEPNKWINI